MLIDRRAKSDSTVALQLCTADLCNLATVPTCTMGSCYLGYGLVLYTPIIYYPVCILGNDYPGMGTVARLHKSAVHGCMHKSAVHGCMHAAWWYIFVHGNMYVA